jgi:hypothetical protein
VVLRHREVGSNVTKRGREVTIGRSERGEQQCFGGREAMVIWGRDSETKHGWLVSKATEDGDDECVLGTMQPRDQVGHV